MAIPLRTTEATEVFQLLQATLARLRDTLDAELVTEAALPLERYRILLMLARAEDGTVRPSDLAAMFRLTASGVSRLIDRLVADGLLERRTHPLDRRGTVLAMTSEGEAVFRRAGRVHLRGINEHVGAVLTKAEMGELRRILVKLGDGLSSPS